MSPATVAEDRDLEFRIELERRIDAPIGVVFETLVEHMGPEFVSPEVGDLSLELELWPGGRWYRNLGGDDDRDGMPEGWSDQLDRIEAHLG